MTNFEKYKDEMLKVKGGIALKDGKVAFCKNLSCKYCDFYKDNDDDCNARLIRWLCEDGGEQETTCSSCKHASRDQEEYPCSRCSRGYTDLFEPKPKKTRQSEFLERYPNAKKCKDILKICPAEVDIDYKVCETYSECADCRRDYWLQEVEE